MNFSGSGTSLLQDISYGLLIMEIRSKNIDARGIRFSLTEAGSEIARAYLYIMYNDLHQEPFGLLEDIYVAEDHRGKGLGTQLVEQVVEAAREQGCYKLIANSRTSRPKVHELYKRLGFNQRGLEFRFDF